MKYTEGFNPHMKMTFALPLSIGTESQAEFMDVKLTAPIEEAELIARLQAQLPCEIEIKSVASPVHVYAEIGWAEYEILFAKGQTDTNAVEALLSSPLVITKRTKNGDRQVDISKYGVIFAGAQKNLAPAGLTIVIVKKELAGRELPFTPLMLNWKTEIDKDSMYNTPPCWCIYMLGLVCDWLEEQGGVPGMEKIKHQKAQMLYDVIDNSKIFTCPSQIGSRSDMNVVFRTASEELDALFVKESTAAGLANLKGHRNVGGMRASIYNAMPMEGIEKLCAFIQEFDKRNS
jgi:phosphoserine aminotransferase